MVLHPDTRASTNYGDVAAGLLLALKEFNKQTICRPNSDAHADSIAKSIAFLENTMKQTGFMS